MHNTEKVTKPEEQVSSLPVGQSLSFNDYLDPSEMPDKHSPAPKTEKAEDLTWETEEAAVNAEGTEPKVEPKAEAKPVDETRKNNLAWIKARQERAALKKRIAELESARTSVARQETDPVVSEEAVEAKIRAKILAETQEQASKRELESKIHESYELIASDPDINSVPSGLMDVLDLIETDPKLAKIHEIDPVLALTEAKKVWMVNKGISKPSVLPVHHTPASRMSGTLDLQTVLDKLTRMTPGTKQYNELYKQYKQLTK